MCVLVDRYGRGAGPQMLASSSPRLASNPSISLQTAGVFLVVQLMSFTRLHHTVKLQIVRDKLVAILLTRILEINRLQHLLAKIFGTGDQLHDDESYKTTM
ncbi:uncharacterized protein [Zea mays]|uniref:Uncharacterized protein n=1 Tax=Zea mays TaxID=4577 RepID=A0A804QVK8_MAIZE|nr:uncharacterized protein LOC103636009 [Zea mays]|eukprot:XP_020398987.1 uncharacterized protein LOC103636009 [Zea mays]